MQCSFKYFEQCITRTCNKLPFRAKFELDCPHLLKISVKSAKFIKFVIFSQILKFYINFSVRLLRSTRTAQNTEDNTKFHLRKGPKINF